MKHINIFISIVIVSSIILCTLFGFLIFYNEEKPNNKSKNYENAYIEYEVSACQGDIPLDTKIYIVNKSIIFHQNISSYCYPPLTNPNNFKIEVLFNSSSIMIWETFNTDEGVSRCLCPFGINGTISGIPSGSFKLMFIFDNRYVMQTHIIKEFEIYIL